MSTQPVLTVDGLSMQYETRAGPIRAVDGVSFTVLKGQSLGLVGESGCGKSSIALSLLRLLPETARITGGRILLNGTDIVPLTEEQVRRLRWNSISLVFQAAMNSLNPVYRVGEQIIEALDEHVRLSREEADTRVRELFDLVGLDQAHIDYYPHEYSGGMKQRAVIAMALSCDPDIVVADEPTTALDVIVQDRILREMKRVREELDMSMIYISHDMAVIAEVSDVVGVMYAGRIVELGSTADVFGAPIHPYTKALISAFPSVTGDKQELVALPGEPPNLLDPPTGCRFNPRCPFATDAYKSEEPPVVRRGEHYAYCWNPLE